MVEQGTKEETVPSDTHVGESGDKKASQGGKPSKKRSSRGSYVDKKNEGVPELLKVASFSISRDGPDMYLKAMKRLSLYVCTMYKNGSDVQMCLDEEESILPEEQVPPENPPHQKNMWDLRATAAIKNEELLKQNLRSLYVAVMSLCDPIMEDNVSCHESFPIIKHSKESSSYRSSRC